MSETYDLFQKGRDHLSQGRAAQATVSLEKLGRKDEARGHMKLASSLRPGSSDYAQRARALE